MTPLEIEFEHEEDSRWIARPVRVGLILSFPSMRAVETGPRMLARMAKHTGLKLEEL
jgi:hypothetical protein